MVTNEALQDMAERLYVYDVEQKGWEQEPGGFEDNVAHVLLHLVKDSTGKDFYDATVAKNAIAPDALQYAIRLSRWSAQDISSVIPDVETERRAIEIAQKLGNMSIHHAAYIGAASTLAHNLHDLDHTRNREFALILRTSSAKIAGGLLVHSANLQAELFGFDLNQAFNNRLGDLRERFNIPEPS